MRRSNEAAGSTSAYLIGRWGSSAFMLSTTAVVDVARGLVLLYGIGTSALPSWDPRMGRSNLMGGLAGSGRQAKRTCELTSSIVPRGTPFHRRVELEFPPIAIGLEQLSCRCCIPSPAEVGAVNPDAVQDHGQPACQCDDGPFYDDAQKMRAVSQCHEIHDRGTAALGLEFGLEDQRAGPITPTDRNKRLFWSNQPPAGFSAPSRAAKHAAESKRGQQSQSIEPSRPTLQSPISA